MGKLVEACAQGDEILIGALWQKPRGTAQDLPSVSRLERLASSCAQPFHLPSWAQSSRAPGGILPLELVRPGPDPALVHFAVCVDFE